MPFFFLLPQSKMLLQISESAGSDGQPSFKREKVMLIPLDDV
jgi:hypothetical protein